MSPTKTVPTIRKFNPGVFQSDQELREQFAVRHKEFDAVLKVVNRNLASESCQHVLIVAPRGMGKSMMLARMEAELRLDPGLASKLLPVRFMEESYEVTTLTDFWLEALFQLGRECRRQDLDVATELETAHASLCARWRDTHLQLDVLAAIERGLASTGRRMVLMVENLQAISDTWDSDDEWGLRGILQTEPSIMLIGTATTRFRSLEDADCAFFDLFRLIELGPLTTKECAALWNTATQQHLETREIRPFEILTGGSPRLLVLLAGVGRRLTLKQLLEDMVGLIDEHTEYFRQCLEGLPPGERRVFLALADLWEPAPTSAIADRARMDIRTASVMVRRLMDRGAVRASGQRRSRRYFVTERMFCFYYSLRRERNQAEIIRRFIAFMVAFYDPSAATTAFADLSEDSDVGQRIREQLFQVIVAQDAARDWMAQWDDEFKTVSLHHLWMEVLSEMQHMVEQCSDAELADEDRFVDLSHRLRRLPYTEARPVECVQLSEFATKNENNIPPAAIIELCETCLVLMDAELVAQHQTFKSWAARTKMLKARVLFDVRDYTAALDCCDEVVKVCPDLPEPDRKYLHSGAILVKQRVLVDIGDYESAVSESRGYLKAYGQSEDETLEFFQAQALLFLMHAELQVDNQDSAEAAFRELDSRFGNSQDRHLQLAVANAMIFMIDHLSNSQDKANAATECKVVDMILARFGGSPCEDLCRVVAFAVNQKVVRHIYKGDLRSAERCLRLGMERWVSTATDFGLEWVVAVSVLRAELLIQLGEYQEAESLVQTWLPNIGQIEEKNNDNLWWRAELVLFVCCAIRGDNQAIDVLSSVVEGFNPEADYCVWRMTIALIEVGAHGKFLDQIPSILEGQSRVRDSLLPVIIALRMSHGDEVSAPLEVLKVAWDVWDSFELVWQRGTLPDSLA